jgi:quinol monooxygenase YgiN
MVKVALLARLVAKPGKEEDVAAFLSSALPLAQAEAATVVWFALRISKNEFGIFDAFPDDVGRKAHLNGPIAAASWRRRASSSQNRRKSSRLICSQQSSPSDCQFGRPGCLFDRVLAGVLDGVAPPTKARAVVREYVEHYHHERNHQGLDNVIPLPLGQSGKRVIRRHERLGGVLGNYRWEAA